MDTQQAIYYGFLYGIFEIVLLFDIVLCVNMYFQKKKASFLQMGICCLLLEFEALFEILTILAVDNGDFQSATNYSNLAVIFTRSPMILYMWVVVNRLYQIRFSWPGLKLYHFAILYISNVLFWVTASIIALVLMNVGVSDFGDWWIASMTIDFVSYGMMVLTTFLAGYKVAGILFQKKKKASDSQNPSKLTHSEYTGSTKKVSKRKRNKFLLYTFLYLSNGCFVCSLVFWIVGDLTVDYCQEAAWIICYATTALHFAFEIFFQNVFANQLELFANASTRYGEDSE